MPYVVDRNALGVRNETPSKCRLNADGSLFCCMTLNNKYTKKVNLSHSTATLSKCPGKSFFSKCKIGYDVSSAVSTVEVNLVLVLWALSLDVSWLAALVAGALGGGLGWAVAGKVANLTAVVALLSVGAVAGHVSKTTAGVAVLLALLSVAAVLLLAVTVVLVSTLGTGLWAVTGDVADLGALVALLVGLAEGATLWAGTLLWSVLAVAGDVAWLTALVASLVLWSLWALTGHVSLPAAVVALGWPTGWAVASLVGVVTAWEYVSIHPMYSATCLLWR